MKQRPKIVTRAVIFYKKHGFWELVKAAPAYLLNEYQVKRYRYSLSLKAKLIGQGRRIFYIDYFSPENSNLYWLKAFRKFGRVGTFDIRENRELLTKRIMNFKPVHIHLGGSVKNNMVSPQLLSDVKAELNCTISVFYGDGWYSLYHCELAKVVDYVYVSNKTHIKINQQKGYDNFKYMPCPTDTGIFNYKKCGKSYDLVFIGNNYSPSRLSLLKRLADNFNLKVFGNGWEKTGLNYGSPIYGGKFSRTCNRAKICLGVIDPIWADLEAHFSNRLVNTLATRSFFIQAYTLGLENVFTNHKHLVWYTKEEELFQLIEHYLSNEAARERIAAEGQKEVYQKYTYEKSIERILSDVKALKPLKLHLGCGSNLLEHYVNIDKYNPKADRIMDATELDYPDNSVDEIFTSHMVEYIAYPEFMKALREWKRVLKENATLIIRCPNFEKHLEDWLNADYRKRWGESNEGVNVILGFQDRGPGYFNRNIFTIKRLKNLVSMAGFEVLECHSNATRDGKIPDGDILLRARKARANTVDEAWQSALTNEIAKGGERFTLKWYKSHPITKELLKSSVLRGQVIELGCGIGARAFLAQEQSSAKITGIDASQYAINHAINNFSSPNLNFLRGDLLGLPFKNGAFDNAYMLAVIEYIVDTNGLLSEIKRVVKPKGKLLLSVTEKDYHGDPSHVHIFTKNSLKDALHEFKILNIYVKEHIIFAAIEV